MTPRLVAYLAAAVTSLLVAVDVVLATDRVRGNTWSEVVCYWGLRWPIVPWAWGVLLGHFFGRGTLPQLLAQPAGVAVLLWLTCLAHLAGKVLGLPPLVTGLAGVAAGALCWAV